MAGKVIGLKTGESVTVGRAVGRAQFALPHDTFMSGVHFAVECGASGCRVQDRKSSNGTFLNGARISEAMLANGDEIKGGQTIFKVKIVADAKLASMAPPQEVAPPAAPPQRPREPEPVVPPRRARGPEPAVPPAVSQQPQQPRQGVADPVAPPVSPRQRAPEPPLPARPQEPPSIPEPRPRVAEPAASASPPRVLRSRQLQTLGHASQNRRSRQRKLRHRGPQKLLMSKSQRSASSLNFGRLLCRVRAWMSGRFASDAGCRR